MALRRILDISPRLRPEEAAGEREPWGALPDRPVRYGLQVRDDVHIPWPTELGLLCTAKASFETAIEYGKEYLAILRGDLLHHYCNDGDWSFVYRVHPRAMGWVPRDYLEPVRREATPEAP